MQKISLYLIITITILGINLSTQASNLTCLDFVRVKLFSKLNKIEYIELKSNLVLLPYNKTLYTQQGWKLKLNKNKVILKNKDNKTNHIMPARFILKPYRNNPLCISTSGISKRCYRGNIQVSAKENSIILVNYLPLIDYLSSTVSSEIPNGWPVESVKAQTVVSHTFLLNKLKKEKIIADSTQDQFYGGIEYENPNYRKHIQEVKNTIIIDKNKQPIEALYHSTCAGRTLDNEQVFGGKSLSYLRSVPCKFDKDSNFAKAKIYFISKDRLKELLDTQNLRITRNKAGQILSIDTDKNRYNKYQFWLTLGQKVGWQASPSIKYDISCNNDICRISSVGAGHAVGFCQWGAKGMAEKGFKYTDILRHYYKNTNMITLKHCK